MSTLGHIASFDYFDSVGAWFFCAAAFSLAILTSSTISVQWANALSFAPVVEFELDRDFYEPGDKVTVTVRSPIREGALLTIDVIEGNSDRRVFHASQTLIDQIARQAELDGVPFSEYYRYSLHDRPPPEPVLVNFTLPSTLGVDYYRLRAVVYDLVSLSYSDSLPTYTGDALLFVNEDARLLFITDVELDSSISYRPGDGLPLTFGVQDGLGRNIQWARVSATLCHEGGTYCQMFSIHSTSDLYSTTIAIPHNAPTGSYSLTISPESPTSSPHAFGGERYIVKGIKISGEFPFQAPTLIAQSFDYKESYNVPRMFQNDGWVVYGQNLTLTSKQQAIAYGTDEKDIVKPPVDGVEVNFTVLDPDGRAIFNETLPVDAKGKVQVELPITSDLKRGAYEVYHRPLKNGVVLYGNDMWTFHISEMQQFYLDTPMTDVTTSTSLPVFFSSRDLDASNLTYRTDDSSLSFEIQNNHLYKHRHFSPSDDLISGTALIAVPKHVFAEPQVVMIDGKSVDSAILENDYYFSSKMGDGEIVNPLLVNGNPWQYPEAGEGDYVLLRIGPVYDDGSLIIKLIGINEVSLEPKEPISESRNILRLDYVQFTGYSSPAETSEVGQSIYVSGWIENNYEEYGIEIPYVAIIEVRDEDGVTQMIHLDNGTVADPEKGVAAQVWGQWIPETPGMFQAKVFLLNNLENPQILGTATSAAIEILPSSQPARIVIPDVATITDIQQGKEIELLTYEDGDRYGSLARARITLTDVTSHTGTIEYVEYKKGFVTLVLNYTMENLDNFAFYAQPKIEAIVDGDRYPYQSISGALGSLLLPNETRESFIVFQVVDTATDVSFEVGDTYSGKGAMKPIWTVDVELSK